VTITKLIFAGVFFALCCHLNRAIALEKPSSEGGEQDFFDALPMAIRLHQYSEFRGENKPSHFPEATIRGHGDG